MNLTYNKQLFTNPAEEVNEGRCDIQLIVSKLCCLIVPRKNVVIIMPSFTERNNGYEDVVRRFYCAKNI